MERKRNEAVWWSAQCLTIHAFNFQIKHVHSWAGKLLLLSEAQAQSLPSSIRNWTQIGWTWWHSSACLCRKNHTKSRLSVLPKSCSALWSNYFSSGGTCTSQHPPPAAPRRTTNLHCATPCHAMPCMSAPIVITLIMVITLMVLAPTTPEERRSSPSQPPTARRVWLCVPCSSLPHSVPSKSG